MGFKKFLGNVADKIEDKASDIKEAREERREAKRKEEFQQEEIENKVNDLLDKFEIPDLNKFLMKYLNNIPEPKKEYDEDIKKTRDIRPGRKDYLDFVWNYLNDNEINYNQLKDFALKTQIITPSFFGEESDIGYEKSDFQIIVNSIKADFEPETITNEEHLESQLMIFFKAKFSERKIRRQVIIQGDDRLDILIDDKYAFELKVPTSRTDLRNLGAQLEEYQEKYPNICAVIFDVDDDSNTNLPQDIIDYVDKYKRDYGISSIILHGRKRKHNDTKNITS